MRNLKFSFAFVIAILAVGLTIASKANQLGSSTITACFQTINLTDGVNPGPDTYTPSLSDNCTLANSRIFTDGVQYVSAVPSTERNDCQTITNQKFCCVKLDLDPSAPASVPTLTIGGQTGKFKVVQLLCKAAI